jgi:uncharacterized protein YbbC (DUF1343 family)
MNTLHNHDVRDICGRKWPLALCAALLLNVTPADMYGQARQAPARSPQAGERLPEAPNAIPGLSAALDNIVQKAIAADEIPGAVLLVSHEGRAVHRKAYGSRAVLPQREAMTVDTIFDLASLTKIFATTASVMKLVEQGKIRLNDPVMRYLPDFAKPGSPDGKDQVTIRHLLTHTSGLAADPRGLPVDKEGAWSGVEPVLNAIYAETLSSPPGARFVYSDSGFILLGEIVRRVSGTPLDEFAAQSFYGPLGMKHTRFRPPAEWAPQIAPTEEIELPQGAKAGSGRGKVLRGVVHDPRARAMGGVAGHAGLFSTVDDLAIFCQAMLSGGKFLGFTKMPRELFSAAAIEKMTTPQTPPWTPVLRGLGWDINSAYSAPRGELFPIGSYGHTGFTGTAVWIDPGSRTFYILLANSVHPYGRPAISGLRSKVATAIAAAVGVKPGEPRTSEQERAAGAAGRAYDVSGIAARSAHTKTGLDVLEEGGFEPLKGKHVGLITNHTGLDRNGKSVIDLLAHAEGVKLVALFSPEHGIAGREDTQVASSVDAATNLPIYSLYGDTRRPTDEMLRGVDAMVYDIQDAGVRFYTYTTTMGYAMEEAAKRKIPFYVLDRPDILGGEIIEGPMLDPGRTSFVAYFPMPVRMGMTLGEMAQMFNAENKIGCELHVIAMKDWRRRDFFEETGLPWVAPSPNLRSLDAAVLYPGIEILQNSDVNVGRGTDTPFEVFGAPWIRATELADYLNRRFVPGVRFVPTRYTPTANPHKDKACEGIALVITDRASVYSTLMGLEIAAALARLYPDHFSLDRLLTLLGNQATLDRLKKGDLPTRIVDEWGTDLDTFRKIRAKYLLYP